VGAVDGASQKSQSLSCNGPNEIKPHAQARDCFFALRRVKRRREKNEGIVLEMIEFANFWMSALFLQLSPAYLLPAQQPSPPAGKECQTAFARRSELAAIDTAGK